MGEDLKALLRGEEIDLPSFNFSTGQREYKGDKLRIDEHTILILEGIHALNPELTPQIPAENKYKIYVSALTTISLDDHNWIPTTDNRLLRRIIRDFNYRGYSARETISRWPSVRAGEDKWILSCTGVKYLMNFSNRYASAYSGQLRGTLVSIGSAWQRNTANSNSSAELNITSAFSW